VNINILSSFAIYYRPSNLYWKEGARVYTLSVREVELRRFLTLAIYKINYEPEEVS